MSPAKEIESICFRPPLAIGRVGGGDSPLDAFAWDTDRNIHGAHRTIIRPAMSLEVLRDGSLRPYLPNAIQFRDRGLLRPVAPFFELWAKLTDDDCYQPLTSSLLEHCGGTLDNIEYIITVGNRKAQRRTGTAACAYIARVSVSASDHNRKQLWAFSPVTSGEEPLVYKDHPISLGHFQAIKPVDRLAMNVDLGVLRVRFTPAKGEVYGPPHAIAGPASPLPQGIALAAVTQGGRLHEIVPERNRILNPHTPWSRHIMDERHDDPQPSDSYDGANVGNSRSWGVVDDTCDGIIEAYVVLNKHRYVATARVLSSCPDFAPDRRPFYSVADDLADRDLTPINVSEDPPDGAEFEIADLFERAFETASMFNLDALRTRAIAENLSEGLPAEDPSLPQMDDRSMTSADRGIEQKDIGKKIPPYANLTADLFPYSKEASKPELSDPLPYAAAAQFAHAKLCDLETLIDFLRSESGRVERLIRPPFGRFSEMAGSRPGTKPGRFRDPRNDRDTYHDMRMPPYMRDSDQNPLSITRRQYDALLQFIASLKNLSPEANRAESPISDTINRVVTSLKKRL
jgi:hypothetical protein